MGSSGSLVSSLSSFKSTSLVSSTRKNAVEESLALARQLAAERMSLDAFIVNRVASAAGSPAPEVLAAELARHIEPSLVGEDLRNTLGRVIAEQNAAAERDGARVSELTLELASLGANPPPVFTLPELRGDVSGVDALGHIARRLA